MQKEESLDKKMDNLEAKEELLQKKLKQADEKLIEAERIKNSQIDNLERISGLTAEQAKEQLLASLDDELTHERAVRITNYEQQLKEECEAKAREYISLAISHDKLHALCRPYHKQKPQYAGQNRQGKYQPPFADAKASCIQRNLNFI